MTAITRWTFPKRGHCAAAECLNQMSNPSVVCVQQLLDYDIVLYAVVMVETIEARRCRRCRCPRRLPQHSLDNLVESPLAVRVAAARQEKCTLVMWPLYLRT